MTRYPFLFTCALVVFAGSVTAWFATLSAREYDLRGYVDATSTLDLPFRVERFGVNVELTRYTSPEALAEQLDLMESAGVVWVRQFARWNEIEPLRGEYDWSQWDIIAEALRARPSLSLVAVLMNTPEWARDPRADQNNPTAPPADIVDFANFARIFSARYDDVINTYQLWDEPNLFTAWGGLFPRPVEYLALLGAGAGAIREVNSRAYLLSAALAPTTEITEKNISDIRYLEDLYQLGVADMVDGIAVKPYGFNTSPEDRIVREDVLNFSRIVALREVMTRHGDHQTLLWASHWGWNSLPDTWAGTPSIWGAVSADDQRDYTLGALARVEREMPWVGGMILHQWQPVAALDDPQWGFALVSPDGTPSPMLEALIQRAREMPIAATNGLYPPQTAYAQYSGVWTFSDLGADIGWQRDSRLGFDFHGRDVAFILRRDDYVGYLYPLIDGTTDSANALPRDNAGNPYVILTSPSLQPELSLVTVARDLPAGQHRLEAVADRGFDRWALVGYAVSSGNLADPYERQSMIALFTMMCALGALIVTGWQMHWGQILRPLGVFVAGLNITTQLIITGISSLLLMVGMLFTWGDAVPQVFRREPVNLILAILTSGLLYLSPWFVLSVVCAGVLFVLIYHRVMLGLGLVVLYAPFFLFPVELYRFAFPMSELLFLLTVSAAFLRGAVIMAQARRDSSHLKLPRWNALDAGVIAWGLLGIISLIWAQNRGVAITEYRTMILEPALFYGVWRFARPTPSQIRLVIGGLMVAGVLVAVIGLVLYLQGESIITAEADARRMASVYGSPNNVALFLGRVVPFVLAGALLTTSSRWKGLFFGVMGILLVAVALTQSVGGLFLGLPAGVAGVLIVLYGKRAIMPLLGIALVLGVGFAGLASQSERFARALDFTQGTNFYRLRVWESALNLIIDQPLTGVGLDQFLYAYRGQYIRPDAWQEPDLSHPHQIILDVWVRLGIGGVILLGYWIWAFRDNIRRAKVTSRYERFLLAGTTGAMANLLSHGMIDNSIYVMDLSLVFVLLLALSVSLTEEKLENSPQI